MRIMRVGWVGTGVVALLLGGASVGCDAEKKVTAENASKASAAAVKAAPAAKPTEPAKKAVEATSAKAPTKPQVAKVAKVAMPSVMTADEMKELERRPGATSAPKDKSFVGGPKAADLPGNPGPSPSMGASDAPVKVFVFSDFQCPVCRRAVEPLKQLVKEFPGDVEVVWKQNALKTHRRAEPAAIASIAAHRQGKFWAFHDKLFQNQRNLADEDFELVAEELKLDMTKFKADIADVKAKEQVEYERSMAEALGARGTPGFFINGKKAVGWGSYAGLRANVQRAIAAAKPLEAKGVKRADIAKQATASNGVDGAKLATYIWGN